MSGLKQRNIAVMLLLTVVTLGIYPAVWIFQNNTALTQKGIRPIPSVIPFLIVFAIVASAVLKLGIEGYKMQEQVGKQQIEAMKLAPEQALAQLQKIAEDVNVIEAREKRVRFLDLSFQVMQWLVLVFCAFKLGFGLKKNPYNLKLNKAYVLLMSIFYLQHQINKSLFKGKST